MKAARGRGVGVQGYGPGGGAPHHDDDDDDNKYRLYQATTRARLQKAVPAYSRARPKKEINRTAVNIYTNSYTS